MTSERGREIHGRAEHAREAGSFVDALKLTDEALVVYAEERDIQGFTEVISSRLLTLRHLYEQTDNKNYLILAKHTAMSAVEIAEQSESPESLSMPYFNLAKAYDTLGEWEQAVTFYQKAVNEKQQHPGELHNRKGVMSDMEGHLAIAQYKNGDKEALTKALQAIEDLKNSDEPQYNKDVWVSGGYMRLAEALATTDAAKARKYLDLAQETISANPDLVLRQNQIDRLRNKLSI